MQFESSDGIGQSYQLTDDDVRAAGASPEALSRTLLKLQSDLVFIATKVAKLYRVDEAALLAKIDGTLNIVSVDGRQTITRCVHPHGKPASQLDLIQMFSTAPCPANAVRAYFRMILEARAQRLSKKFRREMRNFLRLRSTTGSTAAPSCEMMEQARVLVDRLSEEDQQILRLYFLEGWTQPAIASTLGTTRDRLQSRVSFIRAELIALRSSSPSE